MLLSLYRLTQQSKHIENLEFAVFNASEPHFDAFLKGLDRKNQYYLFERAIYLFLVGLPDRGSPKNIDFAIKSLTRMHAEKRPTDGINYEVVFNQIIPLIMRRGRYLHEIDFDYLTMLLTRLQKVHVDFDFKDKSDDQGVNLLMAFAGSRYTEEWHLKSLLEMGYDVDALSDRRGKAMHFLNEFILYSTLDKLKLLIAHGANPSEDLMFQSHMVNEDCDPIEGTMLVYRSLLDKALYEKQITGHILESVLDLLKTFESSRVALDSVDLALKRIRANML